MTTHFVEAESYIAHIFCINTTNEGGVSTTKTPPLNTLLT